MKIKILISIVFSIIIFKLFAQYLPGDVVNYIEISANVGGFTGQLAGTNRFGSAITKINDLDGNGVDEIVVGEPFVDDYNPITYYGGVNSGAIWVLFMNPDGTVMNQQKISATEGNFYGNLTPETVFGSSLTTVGDIDGNGVDDIAVGSFESTRSGAVWILLLENDGMVKTFTKIEVTDLEPLIEPFFENKACVQTHNCIGGNRYLGRDIAGIGDFNNDGSFDIAVGIPNLDYHEIFEEPLMSGEPVPVYFGGVVILSLDSVGSVYSLKLIDRNDGNLNFGLDPEDSFATVVQNIGDIDNDGIVDLAVYAAGDDDDGIVNYRSDGTEGSLNNVGALYILMLDENGNSHITQKISANTVPFRDSLHNNCQFGRGMTACGDLDNDGVQDMIVAAPSRDSIGDLYVLLMNANGTVKENRMLDLASKLALEGETMLGFPISYLGDIDADGYPEIAVGAGKKYTVDRSLSDGNRIYILSLFDSKYRVEGQVYANGNALQEGEISLVSSLMDTIKSDIEDGEFMIDDVIPGTYLMEAIPKGTEARQFAKTVDERYFISKNISDLVIDLYPFTYNISGTVFAGTDKMWEGSVQLISEELGIVLQEVNVMNAKYTFNDIKKGHYSIKAIPKSNIGSYFVSTETDGSFYVDSHLEDFDIYLDQSLSTAKNEIFSSKIFNVDRENSELVFNWKYMGDITRVSVVEQTGRLVSSFTPKKSLEIDISDFPSGLYCILLYNKEGKAVLSEKVVF